MDLEKENIPQIWSSYISVYVHGACSYKWLQYDLQMPCNYECSIKLHVCIILIGLVLNGLHAAVHGYMHTISVVLVFVCKNRCIFIAGLLAMATLVTVFLFPFKSGNFVL